MRQYLFLGCLIIAAIVVIVIAADILILTDRERIEHIIREIEAAVEASDAAACMSFVSSDYDYDGIRYDDLYELCTDIMYRVRKTKNLVIKRKEIEIRAERKIPDAIVLIDTLSIPAEDSPTPSLVKSIWKLVFEKNESVWLISEVELVSLDGRGYQSLEELMEEVR